MSSLFLFDVYGGNFLCAKDDSKDVGDKSVRNLLAIFLPTFPILGRALLLIPKGSVEEQDAQEEDVQERKDSVAEARKAPGGGQHHLEDVVCVPGKAPEPAQQQLAFSGSSSVIPVFDFLKTFRWMNSSFFPTYIFFIFIQVYR